MLKSPLQQKQTPVMQNTVQVFTIYIFWLAILSIWQPCANNMTIYRQNMQHTLGQEFYEVWLKHKTF